MAAELLIQANELKKAALSLKAVDHKLRQQILVLIHQNSSLTVTSIYTKLKVEQSICSQHLAVLRRAGIVMAKREGKQVFYSINSQRLEQLHQCAIRLLHGDKNNDR